MVDRGPILQREKPVLRETGMLLRSCSSERQNQESKSHLLITSTYPDSFPSEFHIEPTME